MDEQIIIKMENSRINLRLSARAKRIICIVLMVITFLIMTRASGATYYTEEYFERKADLKEVYSESEELQSEYKTFGKYLKHEKEDTSYNWYGNHGLGRYYEFMIERWVFTCVLSLVGPPVLMLVIALAIALINFMLSRPELVLTNKRMYGKNVFGRRMDLPIDSISSVSTIKLFRGLRVATSSGVIKFYNLANVKEFHKEVSNLLVDRQDVKKSAEPEFVKPQSASAADELKKYKELLDMGAITQEEFDAKKKEIL